MILALRASREKPREIKRTVALFSEDLLKILDYLSKILPPEKDPGWTDVGDET